MCDKKKHHYHGKMTTVRIDVRGLSFLGMRFGGDLKCPMLASVHEAESGWMQCCKSSPRPSSDGELRMKACEWPDIIKTCDNRGAARQRMTHGDCEIAKAQYEHITKVQHTVAMLNAEGSLEALFDEDQQKRALKQDDSSMGAGADQLQALKDDSSDGAGDQQALKRDDYGDGAGDQHALEDDVGDGAGSGQEALKDNYDSGDGDVADQLRCAFLKKKKYDDYKLWCAKTGAEHKEVLTEEEHQKKWDDFDRRWQILKQEVTDDAYGAGAGRQDLEQDDSSDDAGRDQQALTKALKQDDDSSKKVSCGPIKMVQHFFSHFCMGGDSACPMSFTKSEWAAKRKFDDIDVDADDGSARDWVRGSASGSALSSGSVTLDYRAV